jgi:hypothetical protein
MYAGALFLTSLRLTLSADPIERRTELQRARKHGLDVPRIAVVTAEHTIESALDNLTSSVEGPLPDLSKQACGNSARQVDRVDSCRGRHIQHGAGRGERNPEVPALCALAAFLFCFWWLL